MPEVGQTRGNTTNWSASRTYLVETRHDCRSWNATIAVNVKEKRVALLVIDTPMHGRLSSYQASSHGVQCCNLHFPPSIYSERRFVSRPTSILCTPPPIGERSIVMSVCCLCVFVCPRSYRRNYTSDLHQMFCACYLWPWLGPPLAVW